jgi:hypothetical protein
MAGTTTKGFRYPTAGDNPAVHTDIFNLATDVDTFLTAPQVTTSVIFEGATADAFETTLTVVDPTADRTITLPNSSGTVALTTSIDDQVRQITFLLGGINHARATALMLGGM